MNSKRPVLVVDDNEINQMVAVEELELGGYSSDVAGNGLEALEKIKQGDYRMILMDCQMPIMDGFQATQEIRKWESGQGTRTPIVAVTAHEDEADKARAISSGMDEFLVKPFTARDLLRVMLRHPKGTHPSQRVMADLSPPPEPDLTPGVRRSKRLMELFLEHVPGQLVLLRSAQKEGDAVAVRAHAHKLKGSCLALAAEPMARVAESLQHQADAGVLAQADALVTELEQRFISARGLIEDELGNLS